MAASPQTQHWVFAGLGGVRTFTASGEFHGPPQPLEGAPIGLALEANSARVFYRQAGAESLTVAAQVVGAAEGTPERATLRGLPPESRVMLRSGEAGSLLVAFDGVHNPQAVWFPADAPVGAPRVLGPPISGDEAAENRAVQVLGAAVHDANYVVVFRVGAAEDPTSQVYAATPRGGAIYPALEDVAALEAVAWHEDAWWVVASFEFSRPVAIALGDGTTGQPSAPPAEIAHLGSHPALTGLAPARLAEDGRRLMLTRSTPAGDPLRPMIEVATRDAATAPAAVARRGHVYGVLYADRSPVPSTALHWRLFSRTIECEGNSQEARQEHRQEDRQEDRQGDEP